MDLQNTMDKKQYYHRATEYTKNGGVFIEESKGQSE